MSAPAVAAPTLHVKVHAGTFGAAVATALHGTSARGAMAVLGNVLVEADAETVKVTGTDLEMLISRRISAEVSEPGLACVPGRLLAEFVESLDGKAEMEITFDTGSNSLVIMSGRFQTRIQGVDVEEFPPQREMAPIAEIQIAVVDLRRAVGQAGIAVSADESRPVLTGIRFDPKAGGLGLVATDGHRLAIRSLPLAGDGVDAGPLIVPGRALAQLVRVLKEESGPLTMTWDEREVHFRTESTTVRSRLIDGDYPDIERVMPEGGRVKVSIVTRDLDRTLRAVGVFSLSQSRHVRLSVRNGELGLAAATPEVGESSASMVAEVEGEPVDIAVNHRYLVEALAVLDAERAELLIVGPRSPLLLRAVGSDEFRYVVMPIVVGPAGAVS